MLKVKINADVASRWRVRVGEGAGGVIITGGKGQGETTYHAGVTHAILNQEKPAKK